MHQKLHALWLTQIPAPLCQHSWPASYRDGCLYVETDSSAWASMIRLRERSLVDQLCKQPDMAALQRLRVRVSPRTLTPANKPSRRRIPAANASGLLMRVADDISDPRLKTALRKLAQTMALQRANQKRMK